jgi:iron(III) transport system ATP-binding protein
MSFLKLQAVTKRFGQVTAVQALDLEVQPGECFSILGPSGCGKTTTLRMVAGFEDLDEGEILVGERLISSSHKKYYLPPEKRDFGMVFQAFAVWPHLSVFDNVAFPLRLRRISRAEIETRTRQALGYANLEKQALSYPHELSGGEKQRVALARALVVNPAVMLLDEPLSNLDPHLREEMRFEIKDLQRRFGFAILYVTHDQAEAMALSDRIMVMDQGVKQQVDTPLKVYNHPANRFVFSFIGLSNFIPVELDGGAVYVAGAREAGSIPAEIPVNWSGNQAWLACRPAEIDFVEQGLRAVVARKAYLGEIIDYRLQVGPVEVRVQKPRRQAAVDQGQAVALGFSRALWYPRRD